MKILNPKEKFILRLYITRRKFMKAIKYLDRRGIKYIVCKVERKPGIFEFSVKANLKNSGNIIKSLNL